MSESTPSTMRDLLTRATTAVRDVADAETAWSTPPLHSPAGTELASEEARRPEPQTGSWPWLGSILTARWALWAMIEETDALSTLLEPDATSYAADVLCRAVLEAASLAWWLLDPDIDAQRRTARWLVYRLHAAGETAKAVDTLQLEPGEDRSGYGESVADVQTDIDRLGWIRSSQSVVFDGGKEAWLGYTQRVGNLVGAIWPQRDLPYRMLSAVAHAELLGLTRNLTPPAPSASEMRPAPGPAAEWWLWQDAYLVSGALLLTAVRAASFLGLDDQVATLNALTQHLTRTLPSPRPKP